MTHVPRGAPLAERGGRLRGVVDLVAGRYPPFLFGLGVGSLLPVFHFHDTTPDTLEPAFRYLAENGYTTVQSDALAAFTRAGRRPPPRAVMLAFDDALTSLWTVVAPLLERYGLRAVAYAIPARIAEASAVRPRTADGAAAIAGAVAADEPFATWPEIEALSRSGLVDVQSHTWSHSMIFCGSRALGVIEPSDAPEFPLDWPRANETDPPTFVRPSQLGSPLFPRRSRMADARRFLPNADACRELEAFVSARGGAQFFATDGWKREIAPKLEAIPGTWESDEARARALEHELAAARETLEHRLGTRVRHVCLPWGVSGAHTRALLERLGFETAFANRFTGMFAVRTGDDPFFLKRLANRYIFALPGRGRRTLSLFS